MGRGKRRLRKREQTRQLRTTRPKGKGGSPRSATASERSLPASEGTGGQAASRGSGTRAASPRRSRLGCWGLLLGLGGLLLLGGVVALTLWSSTPSYWEKNQAYFAEIEDNATLVNMAVDVEQRLVHQLSARRSDGPDRAARSEPVTRKVFVHSREINAWLRIKLEDWAAHANVTIPNALSDFMVATHDGLAVLAFRYEHDGMDQIVSVFLDVQVLDARQIRVEVKKVRAGRLPVPMNVVLGRLKAYLPEAQRVRLTQEGLVCTFPATIEHPGDNMQTLRLADLQVADGGFHLLLRTEPQLGMRR